MVLDYHIRHTETGCQRQSRLWHMDNGDNIYMSSPSGKNHLYTIFSFFASIFYQKNCIHMSHCYKLLISLHMWLSMYLMHPCVSPCSFLHPFFFKLKQMYKWNSEWFGFTLFWFFISRKLHKYNNSMSTYGCNLVTLWVIWVLFFQYESMLMHTIFRWVTRMH